MFKLLKELKGNWRELLTTDDSRYRIQFICVFIILAFVSFGMTVMNVITGFHLLMYSTLVFGICNVINVVLMLLGGHFEQSAKVLFCIEFTVLFTFFVIMGEPEGFSAIWAALLPTCGLILYKRKTGCIMAGIEFVMLAVLLWTPWGNSLLQWEYTGPFKMRFPVLYLAFFAVAFFLEFIRSVTQAELTKARDLYKELYSEESVKSREEHRKNFEIIQVLASEYSAVYMVNLETEDMVFYTDSAEKTIFDSYFKKGVKFSDAYKAFVENSVFEEDKTLMISNGKIGVIKQQLAKQKTFVSTFRLQGEDRERYYRVKLVKVDDIDKDPTVIALGFSDRDYQTRKEMEQQLTLEQALAEAKQASESKSKFLFNMSHDIRTPMNAIIGFTDMAKKYRDDEAKVDECLDKVKVSSTHLLHLINDVLDMSRVETGNLSIEDAEIDIIEKAKGVVTMCYDLAKNKNIELNLDYSGAKDTAVYADALHVNQVFMNVISNAVKYTPNGGKVDYIITQDAPAENGMVNYTFVVKDTGIGMTPEFLEHIFDSFSREKSSTVSGIEGTGLGMAIVKRLVDLLDGSINIESEKNVGTTVTIKLPFKCRTIMEELKAEVSNATAVADFTGKRILLVEDNEMNREIATDILEDEGIIVETAEDGDVAVEMVSKSEPGYYDFVLMDIQMPRMNGYEATAAIRSLENKELANIVIIALSANAFEEDRKKSLKAGMNDHQAKPIQIDKLFESLSKFC